ncbi:hypothetical protein K3495_g6588 [Podosphaera aphanis]|nr:hypothetical protein K3495_g6588 [Podosphaera aphanis]
MTAFSSRHMNLERTASSTSRPVVRIPKYDDSNRPEPFSWRHSGQPQSCRCPAWQGLVTSPDSAVPAPRNLCYGGITIERTPCGNSILSTERDAALPAHSASQRQDLAAAGRVETCFRRRSQDSKYERILRKLIRRDEPLDSGFTLDEPALDSILTAADTLFFDGVLAGRVQWEWSSDIRYRTEIIGTTALRRCVGREGFETLIVLSEPVLRDERYDRRLLLSAFLHELIHCYLFISCGFQARMEGGHTVGFYRIAQVIDSWVGPSFLSICKLRENPERFHKPHRTTYELPHETQVRDLRWETSHGEEANGSLFYLLPVHQHQDCNHHSQR